MNGDMTPWGAFRYRMIVGLAVAAMIWGIFPALLIGLETRFMRDLRHVTPFTDVELTKVVARENTLSAQGTVVKTRDCTLMGAPTAWVVQSGLLYAAVIATQQREGRPIQRPVSPYPQPWGPVMITSPVDWPDEAMVFITHRCPEGVQQNLLFETPWHSKDVHKGAPG